jgi:hypothetical protein
MPSLLRGRLKVPDDPNEQLDRVQQHREQAEHQESDRAEKHVEEHERDLWNKNDGGLSRVAGPFRILAEGTNDTVREDQRDDGAHDRNRQPLVPNSAKDWHRQQRDENEHERRADDVAQAPEIGSRPAAVSAECRNQTSEPGDAQAEAREGQEVELVSHAARVGEKARKTALCIAVFPILMLSSLPHIREVPNPEPVPVSSYRALSIAPRLREACGRGLVGSG